MKSSAFRLCVLICIGTLSCSPTTSPERARDAERVNLFDKSDKNRPLFWRSPQQVTDQELADRIAKAFQQDMNSSAQQQGQTLLNYGIFLGIAAVIGAGLVYWQMWSHKRKERELSDPAFLVNELFSAHQLSEQEKRLMRELSEKNSLATPLKLFIEPKFLLDAWESDAFASSQSEVQQLLSKLFDIAKA